MWCVFYTCEYNVDTLCSYYPLAASDYDSVDFAGMGGYNLPRNLINYRGGNRQDMTLSFSVAIRSDSVEEPPENFFINVMSVRTAIVLTPRVTVTICGGMTNYLPCSSACICREFVVPLCIGMTHADMLKTYIQSMRHFMLFSSLQVW